MLLRGNQIHTDENENESGKKKKIELIILIQ